MRIELTVSGPGGSRDVAIVSPRVVALARVAGDLARAGGGEEGTRMWCGDRPLADDVLLGAPGLRTGARLTLGAPARQDSRSGVLSLHVTGGPAAGRVVPLERGRLTIGRGHDCDVVLNDDRASRRHAVLEVSGTAVTLFDLGSTNGTTVDGIAAASGGTTIRPGRVIRMGDSLLEIRAPDDTPAALVAGTDTVLVNRAPRQACAVVAREIVLPQRSDSARPGRVQWVTALLPALAGGAIAWFTHSPQFLLFALLSPVMMLSTSLGDRLHWRRSRRREAGGYRRRCAATAREVADGLAAETSARRANSPDPAALLRLATTPSSRLWERRRADADHLSVRLGSAELPSTLQVRDAAQTRPAGVVHAVPLCVDLRAGPLGVAGPPDVVAGLSRWLVAQLAALHSPADLALVLLLAPENAARWRWARWLPHLDGRVATGPAEWQAAVADLAAMLDQRRSQRRSDPTGWAGTWTVVIMDRAARLTDVPGLAALLSDGAAAGLSAICVDGDQHALPTACTTVARVRGETGTRVAVREGTGPEAREAVLDQVGEAWADTVARSLAPLVDAGADGAAAVPNTCRLLDLLDFDALDVDQVICRWSVGSGRPTTVVGRSADGPLDVDLIADGPHALVAGTTGAGKSELLQSVVAGLATLHPPDELTFLLVDYKGGAAFGECVELPHTTGLVTDLDPHLTRRALQSLDAELRRRERLFAAVGASDLDGYRCRAPGARSDHEPVPRLIIVVDEFASLADELPHFVQGLVGVAQRGRSLGVHLILATQRPGNAVSAEIRANTSLRIALRVTDPAESTDIIDTADAATIERSRPGRGYLRTGSTLTCFQTARVAGAGEPTSVEPSVQALDEWRVPVSGATAGSVTDLCRLVAVLRKAADISGRAPARRPWLDPLPDWLADTSLPRPSTRPAIPVGLLDLPAEQAQPALTVDLAAGSSLLLVGAPRSGRTSALATTALAAAHEFGPDQLEVYLVDPAGALSAAIGGLPHLATAVGPRDQALTATLLERLLAVAARRVAGPRDVSAPLLLLLVDGWDAFLAAQDDAAAVRCGDLLTSVLRTGAAAGLTVVLSGDRSLLAPRIAGAFGTRLFLRLADRNDYGLGGLAQRDVPEWMPPGRGVRAADGVEFQFAHVGASSGHDEVRRAVCGVARLWSGTQPSAGRVRLRPLPDRVALDSLDASDPPDAPTAGGGAEAAPPGANRMRLGIAGHDAVPVTIAPFTGARRILVAGPPRSGRSTTLAVLLAEAHRIGVAAVVAAPSRSPLTAAALHLGIRVVDPGAAAGDIGAVPDATTLLLVDDSESFVDSPAGDELIGWLRDTRAPLAAVVAGRCDDLATTYRGVAAEVRRSHCGLLLRPGALDGELLGVRLARRQPTGPPGRGVVVGEPAWGPLFEDGRPVPIQVAHP